MILIFEDGGRTVATPNWTVLTSTSLSGLAIGYRETIHGAGRYCLANISITFDEFHRRLVQANNQDSKIVDLR